MRRAGDRGGVAIVLADRMLAAGRLRATLLGGAWLGALAMLAPDAAHAVDGTWTAAAPGPAEWTTGTNWSSTPTANTVPDNTATFTNNGAAQSVTISSDASINTIQFNAGAPAYAFTINAPANTFNINGSGIVNNSAFAPSFTNNRILSFNNASTAGNATITNNGGLTFFNTSTAGNATITNGFTLQFDNTSTAGSATITNNDLLLFLNASTAGSATITNNDHSGIPSMPARPAAPPSPTTIFCNSSTPARPAAPPSPTTATLRFFKTSTGGTARLINGVGGVIDLSGLTNAGITAGSIEGAGTISLGSKNLAVGGNNLSTTFSGVLQDGGLGGGTGGSLTKTGTGTLTLTGINTYTGATTVDAGTLLVNGSIALSSLTTVNAGGTLGGTGIVGATTIADGGSFAPGTPGTPGTAMTVSGSLAFQSGALYVVQLNPASSTIANVTGTATLTGGSVQAIFSPGAYTTRNYTILHSGTLGGTTFTGVSQQYARGFTCQPELQQRPRRDLEPDRGARRVRQRWAQSKSAERRQRDQRFLQHRRHAAAEFPHRLRPDRRRSRQRADAALGRGRDRRAAGRVPADDPVPRPDARSVRGRPRRRRRRRRAGDRLRARARGAAGRHRARLRQGDEGPGLQGRAPSFEQRWSVWGGAYGGYNKTSGDPVVVGSHDLTARTGGFAAGMDYRVAPGTVVGFALAGGGTNWSLANGLGGGKSDAFQAGVYGSTRSGPLYVAAALAYAWHDVSTDRFAFAGNHLAADFNAQSFGGRIETGYRIGSPTVHSSGGAITPYAAVQAQSFRTPSYAETDLNNGGFGLAYAARTGTATRSELGARFDHAVVLDRNAVLTLRGRLAWAHDWVSDPTLTAGFQTLPGASFIVNGATPAKDLALVSAGTELRLANGVTLAAKFDGEFADGSSTYAGTGTVRVNW